MFDEVSVEMGTVQARELRDALRMAAREISDMVLRAPSDLTRRERAKFQSYCEAIAERLEMLVEAISEGLDEMPEETDDERGARWP